MRVRSCLFAAFLVFAFAPQAISQTITWTKGYPRTNPVTGEINVKGTATKPANTTFCTATASVWPKTGGEVSDHKLTFDTKTGDWVLDNLAGLTSGAEYNVRVSITVKLNGKPTTYLGPPALVKAK